LYGEKELGKSKLERGKRVRDEGKNLRRSNYQNNGFEAEGLELNEKAGAKKMKATFSVYIESANGLGGRRRFVNLLT